MLILAREKRGFVKALCKPETWSMPVSLGGSEMVKINICCDPWVPDLPSHLPTLKTGMLVERRINCVGDLICASSNTCGRKALSAPSLKKTAIAILQIILPANKLPDVPRWLLNSKGAYSV
ncbi:hypothetical protein CJ030_MR5G007231 [Morella rubra]|uniref:Uncharacterized protein n=1 Tax=Morella rubra TaxID=262757 RepID=A0A6A1VMN8_9ROSI|nr:hypothetical protein CJ030_MR5G007231 [Morella rubra]